ncbi:hypothetical protein HPB52_005185 [Rhipicephalus sanguineus]|uniref:Reverse transcriptase domain-containing protein n=1 Tax=Rhipicephalus sanguineus TaxID=34632 RepID=A0A9D4PZH3_RHISA|nr:hypothetical protein HPB52_005185 [Rhipicephalus sanguineus]
MPRFTGSVLRHARDSEGRVLSVDLDSVRNDMDREGQPIKDRPLLCLAIPRSQHALLLVVFFRFEFADSNLVAQGKRPWRLNPRLLKDEEAAKDVAGLLCRSLLGGQDLGGSEWDAVKASVAECFREWGKRRAREERAEIKIVSDAILLLSKPLSGGPGVTAALTSLRKELRVLLQRRWDRLRATARAEQWEWRHGVAGTSFIQVLAILLKRRTEFWSWRGSSTRTFMPNHLPPRYSFPFVKSYEQVDICDSPLVEEELLAALKSMKRNRSPGSDGLTVEFYVKFWKVLGKPFTTLVNRLLREGTLSATQREGLITLLCKDESRRTDLRAWRPITLLNCDYKLIAKCLSVRLTPVLSTVLGPYQACCVPGRSCQLHGFAIRDLIEWANARNLSGILCSFDQEKAFDVISHRYLFKVLREAGFSGQFISMVRALYSRPSSAVVIQDRISEPFDVGRGVRQGDPLSPALYVLAFEPLLQRLSSDNSIGRFPLPPGSPPVALFAYADDLSIVVPDEATVCTVLDVMEGYCSASGARINRSKSVVMYLNSAPSSPRPVHGLPVQQRLRILGFHFEPDGLTTENWRLAKQKLTDRIQEISALGCPLTARVTIIRSLLFSFLTYVASVMPVATRTKLVLEGLLFRFLWSGSSMYVARPVIKLPRNKGGLGIPDLGIVATALHLRWTRCLGGTPSPFYAGAASTLARLRDANPGIELDSLELHDLVDLLTPDLPAHCVRYDLSRHSPNWKLITASFLDAKRATFMYRMARGCLPITFRPFTKIPTRGKCPFCGSREDLVHIFSQCALPAALLQRIASLYGHPGVPFETVRFLNPLPAQAVNQYVLLLVECSYQVWVARCAAVFDGRRPGLHEVLAKVRKEIWFVLHRERQHLGVKKFLETWHRPAVIFTTEAGGNGSSDDDSGSVVSFFDKSGAQKVRRIARSGAQQFLVFAEAPEIADEETAQRIADVGGEPAAIDPEDVTSIRLPCKANPSTAVLPSPLSKSSGWMNLTRSSPYVWLAIFVFLSATSFSAMLAWKRLNTSAANIEGKPNDVDSNNAFLISAFNDSSLQALSTSFTPGGPIIGRKRKLLGREVAVFLGIPYAAKTGGSNRFSVPQPVDGWNAALDATKARAPCYHLVSPNVHEREDGNSHAPPSPSEDCLHVNVWAPMCNNSPCSGLTVVVFIHGGGLRAGGNADRLHDGSVLASQGQVVVIVPNYRLGVFGFPSRDIVGAARNPGLLDLAMALDWVRESVAVFGGNSKNVVLYGSGWGSYLAGLFVVSPKLRSHFATYRVILGSGSPLLKSNHEHQTEEHWNGFLGATGCGDADENATLECLRNATASSIAVAQEQFPGTVGVVFPDDFVLPEPPEEFIAEVRTYSSVEVLLTNVISEGRAECQRLIEYKSDGADLSVESLMNAVGLTASQLAYDNHVELQAAVSSLYKECGTGRGCVGVEFLGDALYNCPSVLFAKRLCRGRAHVVHLLLAESTAARPASTSFSCYIVSSEISLSE